MSYPIIEVQGNEPRYTSLLAGHADNTGTPATGGSFTTIATAEVLINYGDLMRINGVNYQTAELLYLSGVDSVKALRNRTPEYVYEKVNAVRSFGSRALSLGEIQSMIDHAKELEPAM